ncbi:MAG: hypothetical protein JHC33_04275 [Ignisphaera sp.]|nr:hypothetical protein [Ignisphaera sp.]
MRFDEVVKIIIRATFDQVMNCLRYNLYCLDPPTITSGMLDAYGIHNYVTKTSFWKTVEEMVKKYNNTVLFKGEFGAFRFVFSHVIEEVYKVEGTDIYVDVLDCSNIKCDVVPRSHALYVYIEGEYNNRVILRLNVVTLLKLAIYENPYFRDCLEQFVQDPFSMDKIVEIAQCSYSILTKHRSIFDAIFGQRHKDLEHIIRRSPLLKKYANIFLQAGH